MSEDEQFEYPYKLKYHIDWEAGDFTKYEQVFEEGVSLTDSLMVFSMLYPPDGSFSLKWFGKDGRTGKEPTHDDVFKIWMMLCMQLSESPTLIEGKKGFCLMVANMLREVLGGNKDDCTCEECVARRKEENDGEQQAGSDQDEGGVDGIPD